jgi:aryl-phospho-beta-D-glucosidase BglC (GH1 family)
MSKMTVIALLLAGLMPGVEGDDNVPPWVTGGDGPDKMLRATGATLCDRQGAGNVVQLHGVNLGGWLEWQNWMAPMDSSDSLRDSNPGHNGYDFEVRRLLVKRFGAATADDLINTYEDAWISERDLDNIKALGLNVVRLTLAYDTLLNEDGTWRDDAFKRIDWLVQKAWDRGIYTVIDYHAFLPPGADQDGSATGYWANPAQQDETVQIWTRLAQHFKGNPAVAMYDLLNEPNNSSPSGKQEPSSAVICALYDRLYLNIRAVDPDHIIAMEGAWDWKTLRDPREAGYHNVVYSFHFYHFGAKGVAENNQATDQDMDDMSKVKNDWGVPALIGEFNFFGYTDSWVYGIRHYDNAGLSWLPWTYKNKASGTNSWGVYTTLDGKSPPIPNLTTDSADEIRSKWGAWSTTNGTFALNSMLGPILQGRAN